MYSTQVVSMARSDLVERLRSWVAGFERHEHVSTWVAAELMREAITELDGEAAYALRNRLREKLTKIRGGLEALREIALEREQQR
jgi:hypothetical protein